MEDLRHALFERVTGRRYNACFGPAPAVNDNTPLLVPLLAALPICLCLAILGVPAIGHGYATAFRTLYLVACLAWTLPLALLQRALWRRQCRWRMMAPALLVATYAMSVLNNLLGQHLAIVLKIDTAYHWSDLVKGLDSCWLALIAFCATHAGAVYYLASQSTQLRLAQALAAARDAELRALRYQINPHFLFNALNAVSALVAAHANHDANRMLARIADFLRATLAHDGGHEHALADELALTEAYLAIEQARLGARLRVRLHAGPDVLDAPVPYLLLQPLVENAVRHGIAARSEPGQLDLHVVRADEHIVIDVRNDASRPTQPSDAHGLGLANVRLRLRQLYAERQQFDAGWADDGRYHVRIALPARAAA
jgi:two-component system sensor histidine kinase AlgZ